MAAHLRKEHCICHKHALACADTKTELKEIALAQLTLIQLRKFFQNSPKRTAVYYKPKEGTSNLKLKESSRKNGYKETEKGMYNSLALFWFNSSSYFSRLCSSYVNLKSDEWDRNGSLWIVIENEENKISWNTLHLKMHTSTLIKIVIDFSEWQIDFSQIGPSIQYKIDKIK